MKKNLSAIIVLVSASAFSLHANTAGQFLKAGFGARAIGLGRAYSVVTNDAGSLYWNPAGLAQITGEKTIIRELDLKKEAESAFEEGSEFDELMEEMEGDAGVSPAENLPGIERIERRTEVQVYGAFSQMSLDRQLGYLGVGMTALSGTFGVGALGTMVSGIDGFDTAGTSTGSQNYSAFAGFFGYAQEVGAMRLGVSAMGMQENIGNGGSVNGGGLNAGLQIVPIPILSAGASVQNLFGVVGTRAESGASYEKLDTILNVSIALTTPPPNSNLKILMGFTTNLDEPETEGLRINQGVAVGLNSFSYLMAGLDGGRPSGGFGLNFKNFQFAYALNTDQQSIDLQHSVEANVVF